MNTMKHHLLFIALFTGAHLCQAQVIHTDLNPDKLFAVPAETTGEMLLDIDNDQVDDIKFVSFNYPSFSIWNLGIDQVDTNNRKIEILYDNSRAMSPVGDYYVLPLSTGEQISSSASYSSNYPQIGDIYDGNFIGQAGKYLGFRLKSGASDYLYGWMAIEFAGPGDLTLTIKEYAYQSTPNSTIQVGQTTGVGIEHHKQETTQFSFFPNPTSHSINLTSMNGKRIDQLRVFTIQGTLVNQWTSPALPLIVSTESWEKGMYLFEIVEEGQAHQKIVVKN
jgi:hypothetical protein